MENRLPVGGAEQNKICASFNHLVWHDSILRGIHVQHREDIDDVILELLLREDTSERPAVPQLLVLEDVGPVDLLP